MTWHAGEARSRSRSGRDAKSNWRRSWHACSVWEVLSVNGHGLLPVVGREHDLAPDHVRPEKTRPRPRTGPRPGSWADLAPGRGATGRPWEGHDLGLLPALIPERVCALALGRGPARGHELGRALVPDLSAGRWFDLDASAPDPPCTRHRSGTGREPRSRPLSCEHQARGHGLSLELAHDRARIGLRPVRAPARSGTRQRPRP